MYVAAVKLRKNHSTIYYNTASKFGGFGIMHVFSWRGSTYTLPKSASGLFQQ
jgi:predicted ATPase